MHRFLQTYPRESFRQSGAELTAVTDDVVAKVFRCPPATPLRHVDIDGVNGWEHFHRLSAAEREYLELDDGPWMLALRQFTPGESLERLPSANGLQLALKLGYRLRDLHERGVPHGDIQPGNVVVAGPDVWLIDLAPIRTRPGDTGHVAGSAPLMAPELWGGSDPDSASDIYALGCLTCQLLTGEYPHQATDLASWALAHQTGEFDLASLPTALAGVVRRMLSAEPAERPHIQALIDALAEAGAVSDLPPMTAGGLDAIGVPGLVESVIPAGAHVHVVGPARSGRSHIARAAAVGLASRGREVVRMQGQRLCLFSSATDPEDPWAAVREVISGLMMPVGPVEESPELGAGDRLWKLEQLTRAAVEAIGDRSVSIVWDDFQAVRPDTRSWWTHFVDAAGRRGTDLSTLVFSAGEFQPPAVRVELSPITPASWNRWRARTLRTEVRDTSRGRWEQLVEEHGGNIGVMFAMLDREVGARRTSSLGLRTDLDTGTLRSMSAGWRERVETLSAHCAFDEVIETVQTLHESLVARDRADSQTTYGLLAAWTNALVAGGASSSERRLRLALEENAPGDPRYSVLLAQLCNALGRHAEGLAALAGVETPTPQLEAEIQSWRAQLALSSGRFDETRLHAERGLALADSADPLVVAHLKVLAHAPDALLGEAQALDSLEKMAPELERHRAPTLLRARLHAYRALGLTRIGALDAATDAHLRALEQIESGGLSAELPTFLLNVGTAYHRQGRLGLAREYYARGRRVAQPTTRASTRALLNANQANVDLALGRLPEARDLVRQGLQIAHANSLSNIEVMCRSVDGDISLAAGDLADAKSRYLGILEDSQIAVSAHQVAEVQLALGETALLAQDGAAAAERLGDARRLIEEGRLVDLEHHLGILRARLRWLDGGSLGTMAGIEQFRRHLLATEASGNHQLVLRQAPHLLRELEREGLDELLREVETLVQRSRNGIATGLGRELRREFFANLPTTGAPLLPNVTPRDEVVATPDVEPFYRMLSLNEVILRGESLQAMLPDALEIAMSLSRAERGFILLRDDAAGRVGAFKVAASRDVGGEPIPSPHLAVSLTIAEEAAQTGRTVVTLNAQKDGRFSEALSVVDLDLTSVLCVPVRDGSGLLGALYLDHRFRPGVFEGELPRMMQAFGHQLALAITNATRLAELEGTRAHLAELLEEREAMLTGLEQRVAELTHRVERRQADSSLRVAFPTIAFGSQSMERVLGQVERVARGDIPVVVTGESGVGKELIARAVHEASPRRAGPFVAFNCGAVSESLFESEIFGHVKGAFTGADLDRHGLFQTAHTGTIFLDEIGEMPLSMQVKLLRVLQERQIRRVGESRSTPIDVRVVAATNRDLLQRVREGEFREDLYYRLAAFVIEIPPLRDRREDIPLIATKLLERVAVEMGRSVRLTPAGARLLAQCDWYGNVRELENTLRAAAVMADTDDLGEADIAPLVRLRTDNGPVRSTPSTRPLETRGRRRKADRLDVVEAMRRAGDDRLRAAELLGVSERTLYRYLKRWGLY